MRKKGGASGAVPLSSVHQSMSIGSCLLSIRPPENTSAPGSDKLSFAKEARGHRRGNNILLTAGRPKGIPRKSNGPLRQARGKASQAKQVQRAGCKEAPHPNQTASPGSPRAANQPTLTPFKKA